MLDTWLTGINPLVDFALSRDGQLTFANAAVDARVATAAGSYRVKWVRFDNATDSASAAIEATTLEPRATAPAELLAGEQFVQVEVASLHAQYPSWAPR